MGLITKQQLSNVTNYRKVNFSKGLGAPAILNESFDLNKTYDIFLSHSYIDKEEVASLKIYLETFSLSVYIDWIDDYQLNRNSVTKETAKRIKERMKNCKSLLYAFSENTILSKWMPWELGYFDGFKGRVAVLPISNSTTDNFKGTEYVGLYPYITHNKISGTEKEALWVRENTNNYIIMEQWLNVQNPFNRK